MASAVAEQHIRSRYLFQVWDHDPDTASAIVVTPDGGTTDRYVDGRDIERFAVIAIQTVIGSSSGITKLEIIAADDTSGTNLTVIKDSGTVDADALADWLIEECSMDEVRHLSDAAGYNLRYVAGRITSSNSGDEAIVVYFAIPNRKYADRTPSTTIA
jgi:hypothetical protein